MDPLEESVLQCLPKNSCFRQSSHFFVLFAAGNLLNVCLGDMPHLFYALVGGSELGSIISIGSLVNCRFVKLLEVCIVLSGTVTLACTLLSVQ